MYSISPQKRGEKNMPVLIIILYFCVIASMLAVALAWDIFSPVHMSNCVNAFAYQSVPALNVLIVLSETPQLRSSDLLFLLTCCGTVTCRQHFLSALWSLRYQMNVSKQHPCSPLRSKVLACIWCHVGGRGVGGGGLFLEEGIKRREEEQGEEGK